MGIKCVQEQVEACGGFWEGLVGYEILWENPLSHEVKNRTDQELSLM